MTTIRDSAFRYTSLISVYVPKNVTYLGGYSFAMITTLTSIEFAEGIEALGYENQAMLGGYSGSVLYGCSSLVDVKLPSTLRHLGAQAFYGCKALAGTVSLKNVTGIGESTFEGCEAVTDVVLGDIITRVGQKAFYGCIALEEINTPAELTFIGIQAFYGCKSLSTFYFSDKLFPGK